MSRITERYRELPMRAALKIIGIAAITLYVAGISACGMGFQPGWANGWPGISKHTVFAAFMSGVLFFMLLSVGAAVFFIPCSLVQQLIKRSYVGWGAFIFLMIAWAIVATILCIAVFPSIRSSIANDWR